MGFYASSFTFDGIPSETYNLFLRTPDGAEAITDGSSNVEPITQKISRRSKPYFYGTEENTVLSFSLDLFCPTEISAVDLGSIQKWLFGHRQYKRLVIIQPDMGDMIFNVIFINPKILRIGNIIYGVSCTALCDSPYAWTFPKTLTFNFDADEVNATYRFINKSDANDYLYPKLIVTMNNLGGYFFIKNAHDSSGRVSEFTGLSGNEIIEIDNDLKTITSDTGMRRLANFNKKWFRLVPGLNYLGIKGNIASLKFLYQFPIKIGG